jgi:mono/diheme cytochrome c family protein
MPLTGGRRMVRSICVSGVGVAAGIALSLALLEAAPSTAAAGPRGLAFASPQPPDGKQLYATACAACHQPDGVGLPDVYPPLAESEWVTGDEERLIRVVLHGLTGEIEVAGEPFSGAMPAWGPSLDDAQIAAILTYIRRSWGNTAAAIAPATVARVRKATVARTTPWTAKELPTRRPPPD